MLMQLATLDLLMIIPQLLLLMVSVHHPLLQYLISLFITMEFSAQLPLLLELSQVLSLAPIHIRLLVPTCQKYTISRRVMLLLLALLLRLLILPFLVSVLPQSIVLVDLISQLQVLSSLQL